MITRPDLDLGSMSDRALRNTHTTVDRILSAWDLSILGSAKAIEGFFDEIETEATERGLLFGDVWNENAHR